MLALLEQMTLLLRHALTRYAPTLVPMLVAVIEGDGTSLRMPSLQARGAREGTMTAGKHQLNMGNTALCRAVSQGEPCLGGTNPKPRP